jgi:hypothetical protein
MGNGSAVLGAFFPAEQEELDARAWEGSRSRCWAGIHYGIDDEVGMQMGRTVGRLVCSLAMADGIGGI